MKFLILTLSLLLIGASALSLQKQEEAVGTFNPDGSVPYQFMYGVIRGMQAQTQFEGQCWNTVEALLVSFNQTKDEIKIAYLPQNWFNLLDRLRINLYNYSLVQIDCQFYYMLGALKTLMTIEGISALVARAVPQALFFKTIFESIQAYYAE